MRKIALLLILVFVCAFGTGFYCIADPDLAYTYGHETVAWINSLLRQAVDAVPDLAPYVRTLSANPADWILPLYCVAGIYVLGLSLLALMHRSYRRSARSVQATLESTLKSLWKDFEKLSDEKKALNLRVRVLTAENETALQSAKSDADAQNETLKSEKAVLQNEKEALEKQLEEFAQPLVLKERADNAIREAAELRQRLEAAEEELEERRTNDEERIVELATLRAQAAHSNDQPLTAHEEEDDDETDPLIDTLLEILNRTDADLIVGAVYELKETEMRLKAVMELVGLREGDEGELLSKISSLKVGGKSVSDTTLEALRSLAGVDDNDELFDKIEEFIRAEEEHEILCVLLDVDEDHDESCADSIRKIREENAVLSNKVQNLEEKVATYRDSAVHRNGSGGRGGKSEFVLAGDDEIPLGSSGQRH